MMNDALLQTNDLEVCYRARGYSINAVSDVAITIGKNECVALIGESGSGKSTVANTILRVLPENATVTKGEIVFKGKNLLALSEEQMEELRGRDISMIFQDPHSSLNPVLRISDQLTETIMTHDPAMDKQKAKKKAIELLDLVRIPDPSMILNRYPHQLSGGMAQRVVIAQALSSSPSLLIADEPTSALDLTIQAQILKLIKQLMSRLKLSVLLITHDLSVVANLADRVYIMYAGKIVEEDSLIGIYGNPKHHYTAMLLEAVKRLQGIGPSQQFIVEPMKASEQSSCKFHPRCPVAEPKCRQKPPPYVSVGGSKKVLCWLFADVTNNERELSVS
jgi:oligopeptide/dipeptide ABC transporter ATP-binding protein